MRRAFVAALGFFATCVVATEAHAVQYGELRIRSNTTLTADRYGDVVFDAGNITLDCANYQVHISSYTKVTHGGKNAIYADSKARITIKNCVIVGAFDHSLMIENSSNVVVSNVRASTGAVFYNDTGTFTAGLSLGGNIGLSLSNDTGGFYGANINCGFEGIHVNYAANTTIANTTVSGCSAVAIVGGNNSRLVIDNVVADDNAIGLELTPGDSGDIIRNSLFSNNAYNGIALYGCTDCTITSNTARNNGTCDASADAASTGDSWSGNDFGTICGNVPTPH
jgi:parallel beta-helix repeat protein